MAVRRVGKLSGKWTEEEEEGDRQGALDITLGHVFSRRLRLPEWRFNYIPK